MKKIATTILLLIIGTIELQSQDRVLLSGTLSDDIVILNRSTEQIEWRYSGTDGECKECNSLIYLKGDKVVYTYKLGAKMITTQGEELWHFTVNDGEEMQSVSRSKRGLTLAIAGTPMRVVEVDMDGRVKSEVSYDTGIDNIHRQFRQIAKSKGGNYIIPISTSRKIVELTTSGEVVKQVELKESPLYVSMTKSGNWIATCGHSGVIYEIDGKSGEIREITRGKRVSEEVNIEFAAGVIELKNGNLLLTNWVGHNGDKSQPILIELNRDGEVIWQMNRLDNFTFAAGLDAIY